MGKELRPEGAALTPSSRIPLGAMVTIDNQLRGQRVALEERQVLIRTVP
jgi:hypothetical protein